MLQALNFRLAYISLVPRGKPTSSWPYNAYIRLSLGIFRTQCYEQLFTRFEWQYVYGCIFRTQCYEQLFTRFEWQYVYG